MFSTLLLLTMTLLTLALIVALFRSTFAHSYPESIVLTSLFVLVAIQINAEILSFLKVFFPASIVGSWIVFVLVILLLVIARRAHIPIPNFRLGKLEKLSYFGVGFLCAITLATGFLVAPNNWDSLTYHLPRAAHWLQQGSLDFFPPSGSRQNTMSPLADLVFTHLMVADGTARIAYLGQWFAGVTVLVGVGILTYHVFGDRRIVALSVIVSATIPMLLSQMSTTQADLIVGIPLAAAVISWRWFDSRREFAAISLASIALAVSIAIKPTATLLLLPWLVYFAFLLLRKRSWRNLTAFAVMGIGIGLIINFGHMWRLLTQREGTLDSATTVLNQELSVGVVALNLLRNAVTAGLVPLQGFVETAQQATERFAAFVGLDISLPTATYGSTFELPTAWSEDHASAPLHILIIGIAVITMAYSTYRFRSSKAAVLVGILASQTLLISLVIRWQPWINRFTFLIIVFAAPFAGWLIARWRPRIQAITVLLLLSTGMIWVLLQPTRGVAGTFWLPSWVPATSTLPRYDSPLSSTRFSQFFMHHPPTAITYERALSYAESLNPTSLVIDLGEDAWEFPIWAWFAQTKSIPTIARHGSELSTGNVVVVCTSPCTQWQLIGRKAFKTQGPPSPSVEIGPEIVVGLLTETN